MNHHANSVLIGITITEIIFAIIYYVFLRYLFRNFDAIYENKQTVKTFDDNKSKSMKESIWRKNKILSKIPTVLVLIFMAIVVIEIIILPIELNEYSLLFGVLTSLSISATSIYLIRKLNKPIISIIGIIISTVIFFIFMGSYGYAPTLLFIVMEMFIIYIAVIIKN